MGGPGGGRRDSVFATSDGKGFASLLDAKRHLDSLQQTPAQHPSVWNFLVDQLSPIARMDKDMAMVEEGTIDMKDGPYRTNANMETKPRRDPDPDELMRQWVLATTDDEWYVVKLRKCFNEYVDAIKHRSNTRVHLMKTLLSVKIVYESGSGDTLRIRMPWFAGRAMRARIKRVLAKAKAEQERQLDDRRRELNREYAANQARLREDMVKSISGIRMVQS